MKKYLTLDGLGGYFVAVIGLVIVVVLLATWAIVVQQEEATNYYEIDRDINSLKSNSSENKIHYKLQGE